MVVENSPADSAIDCMRKSGVCPIITSEAGFAALRSDPKKLGKALLDAGIHTLEIAYRASDVPEIFKSAAPPLRDLGMHVGLGTCNTREKAVMAIDAGATFIVAAGFKEEVAKYCNEKGVPYVPGVETYTEMETAYEKGNCSYLKLFPARTPNAFKEVRQAFVTWERPEIVFFIAALTGVHPEYLEAWYEAGADVLVHGKAIFPEPLLRAGSENWEGITERAEALLKATILTRTINKARA